MEISQAKLRKNNAIFYEIQEIEGKTAHEQIQEITRKKCLLRTTGPLRSIRLTTRKSDRPRTIKLEFAEEATNWEFLKRANSSLRNGFFVSLTKTRR